MKCLLPSVLCKAPIVISSLKTACWHQLFAKHLLKTAYCHQRFAKCRLSSTLCKAPIVIIASQSRLKEWNTFWAWGLFWHWLWIFFLKMPAAYFFGTLVSVHHNIECHLSEFCYLWPFSTDNSFNTWVTRLEADYSFFFYCFWSNVHVVRTGDALIRTEHNVKWATNDWSCQKHRWLQLSWNFGAWTVNTSCLCAEQFIFLSINIWFLIVKVPEGRWCRRFLSARMCQCCLVSRDRQMTLRVYMELEHSAFS